MAQNNSTPEKYLQTGDQLRKEGKIEEAIAAYKLALSLNPNSVIAHLKLSESYNNTKKIDTSINYYQQAVKLQPENVNARGKLAHCLMQQGKIIEAIKEYETALTLQGEKPVWLYQQLGDNYLKNGQLDKAKITYEQGRELNPQNPWLQLKSAEVLLELGNAQEALTTYQKAIKIQPTNPQFYLKLAEFYFRRDEVEKALATYNQALENNPDNLQVSAVIYKELAKVAWLKLGDLDAEDAADEKAIKSYFQLLETNPEDVQALQGLVEIYRRRQEFANALTYCQQLIKIQPENSLGYIRKAEVMMDQGDIDGAITNYQQAFEIKLEQPLNLYQKYATLLRGEGRKKQAISSYEKLLESNPPTHIAAFIYKQLGEVYQKYPLTQSGEFAQAEIAFQKAKEKYSQVNDLAVGEMKLLTQEIGEIDSLMLVPYRYAIRLNPHDVLLHKNLAEAAIKYQKWDEAVAALRYALKLEPNQPALSEIDKGLKPLARTSKPKERDKGLEPLAHTSARISKLRETLYEPEKTVSMASKTAKVDLVICIITCEKYQHKQQAIRATWLQEVIKQNITYFFVIGKPSYQSYVEGDILYVNAPDNKKIYQLIQFIYQETSFSHIFKIDDNCYVSIDNLLQCDFAHYDYVRNEVKYKERSPLWYLGKTTEKSIAEYRGDYLETWATGDYSYF